MANPEEAIAITVLGASGDLAKKMIYPVLWSLYNGGYFGKDTVFIGYARSKLSHEDLVERIKPFLKAEPSSEGKLAEFLEKCLYINGQYDDTESFQKLDKFIEDAHPADVVNRIFYMALPPSVFQPVTNGLRESCMAKNDAWTRIIVEKPFGKDSESFSALHEHLSSLFTEDQVYRIDHYLGKEMVQNLFALRFANAIFAPSWNRQHIASVMISMKENFGTKGRGGYFDEFGIIRDVMQNHLLQLLTIIAMEKPVSTNPNDIRDEKVKVLKAMREIRKEDIVIGQYTRGTVDGETFDGYREESDVPDDSITPTYATAVFYIKNERWDGVPFIIRCGKGLNEKKAEIRIQFKDVPGQIFDNSARNELVMRVQPKEAIYMKFLMKKPGNSEELVQTDLDMSYHKRFETKIPAAYERLILDVVKGDNTHFVRSDELSEAWRIFTPILKSIEAGEIASSDYEYGSRGPVESDTLVKNHNYVYTSYEWQEESPCGK